VDEVTQALLLVATACAGLFAGGALYVSLVEHPARMSCGPAAAIAEFGPSYRRSSRLQSSLATLCFITAVSAAFSGAGHGVFIAAILMVAVVPFTLLIIMPTNERLQSPTLNPAGPEATALLTRWGRLHAVRTVLGLASFLVLLQALAST